MTGQLGQISYFETAPEAPMAAFQDQVSRFLDRHALRHYSFVQLQNGTDIYIPRDVNLQTNYHEVWIDRYLSRRYDQVDPVCEIGRFQKLSERLLK